MQWGSQGDLYIKSSPQQSKAIIFVLRKKGSKTKERMKEEEIEKGDCPVVYPANAFDSRLRGD